MQATKIIPVQFSAIAAGDGHLEKGTRVDFNAVRVFVTRHAGGALYTTEIQFAHEQLETGLCYLDSGILSALSTFVKRHPELRNLYSNLNGTSHEHQSEFYTSCEALDTKVKGLEQLEALGYSVKSSFYRIARSVGYKVEG